MSFGHPGHQTFSASRHLCLYHFLASQARLNPEALAILAPGRMPLTYEHLWNHIEDVVRTLHAMGVARHDRVALVLPDGPEMAVAWLAVAASATCAPLNPASSADEFAYYLDELQPKALIVQTDMDSPVRAIASACGIRVIELSPNREAAAGFFDLSGAPPAQAGPHTFGRPDEVALALFTSGTTSRPKIVPLTHTNICSSADNTRIAFNLVGSDRSLNILPLFHIYGLIGMLASLAAGASVVCTPGFYAPKFFAWMAEFRPSWYAAVPAMHQAILARAAQSRDIIERCPLRFIRSSAATLSPQVRVELERVFDTPVIESYGMTESSSLITCNPLPPGERKAGSTGVAAGPEVAIMDEMGTLLPMGATGEIVICGPSVMQGYAHDAVANASCFTRGWLRTGDIGYLDAHGYLFITGRLKEMINRGGEKISPREVDEVLMQHPSVAQGVSFAVPHPQLGEDVAAAVVLHRQDETTADAIREFAAMRLAAFKVPGQLLIVDALPKAWNGKVQRIGLAETFALTQPQATPPVDFIPPASALENMLAELWAKSLDIHRVGRHDDFFRLGGDSVLATQLLSRVRDVVNVELPLARFFASPTVRGMANAIETARQSAANVPESALQPVPRDRALPLSYAQQRLWFLDQLGHNDHAYNLPYALRLRGALKVAALVQSLQDIVARHEILRTTFACHDEQPCQVINTALRLQVPVIDLQGVPSHARESRLAALAQADAQRPFDLMHGPLIRASLLRLAPDDHVLLLSLHHIVFDGWSVAVLERELAALYGAHCTGQQPLLPKLPIQYADFAQWQRQRLQGEYLKRHLTYWRQQLSGDLPALALPTDCSRSTRQTMQGARQMVTFPSPLTTALQVLSQRQGVTLCMTLLAAFQTLLYRYTGQTDLLIGTPIAGRTPAETENLIGFFVNTLVLRTDLAGNPRFRDLLQRIRVVTLAAYAYQELPFQKLVEVLQPRRDVNRQPLFQAMFALQNASQSEWELPGLQVESLTVDRGAALFDLTLLMQESGEGLQGIFEYRTDLLEPATITRMGEHLGRILASVVRNPEQRLTDLPLLTAAERQTLLETWNDTRRPFPRERCVHQLFEAQLKHTPTAIAVLGAEQSLTYCDLNQRANRLAHHLRQLGVGPEVLVGLYIERSLHLMVALLGILKAGGAYVPLDTINPAKRLANMLSEARVAVIVTQQGLLDRLPPHEGAVVCLDRDWDHIAPDHDDDVDSGVTPENLAYVMFTSGSTGTPKGVMIPHRGLVNYLTQCVTAYTATGGQGAPVHGAIGFDATITSLFVPLLAGQMVVMVPEAPGTERLGALLRAGRTFDFIKLTPSQLDVLSEQLTPQEVRHASRTLILGGEALSAQHLAYWRRHAPATRLINEYGPTEAVVGCCVYEVSSETSLSETIPIGRPIANTQLYILDRHLQPVPLGVTGELYIGGDGLARGYLNHSDWTAARFVPNPFGDVPGARLYKTGDLARYLPDGNIVFVGRQDHQIKIRGYRVEPGEVEAALRRHPGVCKAVVVGQQGHADAARLVAYVVANDTETLAPSDLRRFLKETLPDYMTPAAFVVLPALPLTASGKIDRRALPVPDSTRPALPERFTPPRTTIERALAAVWKDVLRLDQVGVQDNFFDLGGHSLLMVRVHHKLQAELGEAVTLIDLFTYPTIKSLAAFLAREHETADGRQPDRVRGRQRRERIRQRQHHRQRPQS